MTDTPMRHIAPGLTTSAHGSTGYFGIYHGTVESIVDPNQLGGLRVRVEGVYPASMPTSALPVAVIGCGFGGKLFGVQEHFQINDLVFVMFLRGNRARPVVTGAWRSQSLGLNDLPADVNADSTTGRNRWFVVDRSGNSLELSEDEGSKWAKLASGSAHVIVTQDDGSITLEAIQGTVQTNAHVVSLASQVFMVNSGQVLLQAQALDDIGGVAGVVQLLCNLEMDLHVDGDMSHTGVINIGGYTPSFNGVKTGDPSTNMQPRQTPLVSVISRNVEVGSGLGDVDTGTAIERPETATVVMNGVTVKIMAQQATKDPTALTPNITIEVVGGDVDIIADGKVNLQAPEVDVTGATTAKLSAPTVQLVAGGTTLTVTSSGVAVT